MIESASPTRHLVLGGARSGKSRYAQTIAEAAGSPCLIATAEVRDDEMARRVQRHQQERGSSWSLIEEPLNLAQATTSALGAHDCVVIDCLTLWLTNCLEAEVWEEQRTAFLRALTQRPERDGSAAATLLIVSNEVGLGIVPLGELSRTFVDEIGFLHQDLAAMAERVTLVTAGIPQTLKSATV
ncbi:MAG: bifunctional adenosylcobinamide kinase/adenosylcobinamide-phosphate guanylyltransferase [Pseudomonadota bacterium]